MKYILQVLCPWPGHRLKDKDYVWPELRRYHIIFLVICTLTYLESTVKVKT